jgi:hypothetical protein
MAGFGLRAAHVQSLCPKSRDKVVTTRIGGKLTGNHGG